MVMVDEIMVAGLTCSVATDEAREHSDQVI